jgi:hypothetical protein
VFVFLENEEMRVLVLPACLPAVVNYRQGY